MSSSPKAPPEARRENSVIDPAMEPGRNPFVFVVGCPRSGTTLLQRMLNNHPLLAVANDTHFIPRALEKGAATEIEPAVRGDDVPLTALLVETVRKYHRFSRLGISDEEFERAAAGADTYRELVGALYTAFGRQHGKLYAGEKTPDFVRNLPLLHGLFPQAKSVHIYRDGRDVALSLLDWAHEKKGPGKLELWREQPLAVCALWWRWQVTSGRQAGAVLGMQRYLEVGYEELVNQSKEQLKRIAAFLGLPDSEEMLAYHQGKARPNSGLDAKKAWLPPTAGLRNWRTTMPSRDVELFEALAGDLLSDLGYERAASTISQEVADVAEMCRDCWKKKMAGKLARARVQLDLVR